jgi:uncharacterized protein (TIGR02246 family)
MPGTEEQAVRTVVQRLDASWNAHDMDAFGELFAEDADFVTVFGVRWRDRKTIREEHRTLHKSVFRKSTLTARNTTVWFMAPDVAVARTHWDLVGIEGPAGEARDDRSGIITHVLRKQDGQWLFAVSQNTHTVPPQR